jgi:hypothetical protein
MQMKERIISWWRSLPGMTRRSSLFNNYKHFTGNQIGYNAYFIFNLTFNIRCNLGS